MGNQRHGRKSRAASTKHKRGESTDQSELSVNNDIIYHTNHACRFFRNHIY
jgi:hypothetical protein